MSESQLNARVREELGKGNVGRIRRTGEVPCILYGVEKDTVSLSINKRDIEKILSEAHAMITLNFDGKEQRTVIKEVQYHPLKGNIIHVDFQRVKAGQELSVSVPIKFVGSAPGSQVGGVFQELKSDLDITCLPRHLPEVVEIDISNLNIGDSIHVSDLDLENITIKHDSTTTICSLAAPKKIEEEVPETEEEEIEEEEAEPEVITSKAKPEDEEAEKE